jgi:hypothetical protein
MATRTRLRLLVAGIAGAVATVTGLATTGSPASAAPPTPVFGPLIDPYATYDGQDTCDPSAKPGPVALRAMLNSAYGYDRTGGVSRDCGIGGTSEHKEGRALDYALAANNAAQRADATDLLNWMLATDRHGNRHANARRLGIMYIIWNRQIWKAYQASSGWQTYACDPTTTDSDDCHVRHIHFSFSWNGALKRTTWWTAAGTARFTDFNGDGKTDVLARHATTKDLHLYRGNGTGGFATGTGENISNNWSAFDKIF